MASGRLQRTLTSATRRLRAMMPISLGIEIRTSSQFANPKPYFSQVGARRRRSQIVEQRLCRRRLAGRDECRGIDDRRDANRPGTCRRSARLCPRARRSDRRCRTAPRREKRAPARRARSPRGRPGLDAVPHTELLERALAVLAGWHAVGICHCKLVASERGGESEFRSDLERRRRSTPAQSARACFEGD